MGFGGLLRESNAPDSSVSEGVRDIHDELADLNREACALLSQLDSLLGAGGEQEDFGTA